MGSKRASGAALGKEELSCCSSAWADQFSDSIYFCRVRALLCAGSHLGSGVGS